MRLWRHSGDFTEAICPECLRRFEMNLPEDCPERVAEAVFAGFAEVYKFCPCCGCEMEEDEDEG